MKKIALALAAGVLAVSLTACGEESNQNATNPYESDTLPGEYEVGNVVINGKEVTCVTMQQDVGQSKWGGLDCDFVALYNTQPVTKECVQIEGATYCKVEDE